MSDSDSTVEPDPAAFDDVWAAERIEVRRCLELAYASLAASGLAVGAVLEDEGRIIAEGRNRAYDPSGGPDVLQQTPLAHAELNVLATVRTGQDLSSATLWTTQEPCSMCAAALAFVGVRATRHLALDPWSEATQLTGLDREAAVAKPLQSVPYGSDLWVVTATAFFLMSSGIDSDTFAAARAIEPESGELAAIWDRRGGVALLTGGRSCTEALSVEWGPIAAAARARSRRLNPAAAASDD